MADKVIDDPILNRPYDEPTRHVAFDDEGITDRVEESRRPSSCSTADVIAALLELPMPGTRHAPVLARSAPTDLWLPRTFSR